MTVPSVLAALHQRPGPTFFKEISSKNIQSTKHMNVCEKDQSPRTWTPMSTRHMVCNSTRDLPGLRVLVAETWRLTSKVAGYTDLCIQVLVEDHGFRLPFLLLPAVDIFPCLEISHVPPENTWGTGQTGMGGEVEVTRR